MVTVNLKAEFADIDTMSASFSDSLVANFTDEDTMVATLNSGRLTAPFTDADTMSALLHGGERNLTAAFTDEDTIAVTGPHNLLDTFDAASPFLFQASAMARIETDVESPPTGVEVVERLRVSPAMRHPGIVQGRPLHPLALMEFDASMTATGTAFDPPPPPPPPEDPPDPPPPTPTPSLDPESVAGFLYRWRAADLSAEVGNFISSWPEHNGAGINWASVAPYRPKVIRYKNGDIAYGQAVQFNWNAIEHMWLTLPRTLVQPTTWVFIGWIVGTQTTNVHTHLLDAHDDYSHRRLMHLRPTEFRMEGGGSGEKENGRIGKSWRYKNKLSVFTGRFHGSNSMFRIYGPGYSYELKGNAGTGAERKLLMGRQHDHISKYYASNMVILEAFLYNAAVSISDLKNIIEKYASQTYQMSKW